MRRLICISYQYNHSYNHHNRQRLTTSSIANNFVIFRNFVTMEKSNGNNSNNSKWKSKSNIYRKDKRKLPPNSSGNDNRQSWSHDGNSTERHKGSYNIDLIKDSEEYQRRIVQVGSVKRKYAVCFGYLGTY